jgi:hypothetical protein
MRKSRRFYQKKQTDKKHRRQGKNAVCGVLYDFADRGNGNLQLGKTRIKKKRVLCSEELILSSAR